MDATFMSKSISSNNSLVWLDMQSTTLFYLEDESVQENLMNKIQLEGYYHQQKLIKSPAEYHLACHNNVLCVDTSVKATHYLLSTTLDGHHNLQGKVSN